MTAAMRLVMVGNGMAGVRTLEELLKLAPDAYDITVFGAEPHPNYNRILLSPVLAGEQTLQDIVLNDLDWYRDNHVRLHLGKKVAKIDRIAREVIADDGTREPYDRLLLATGSNPFILPVPGPSAVWCFRITRCCRGSPASATSISPSSACLARPKRKAICAGVRTRRCIWSA